MEDEDPNAESEQDENGEEEEDLNQGRQYAYHRRYYHQLGDYPTDQKTEKPLGHFDEHGQFKYSHLDQDQNKETKTHIDLKHLSERNFLELIEAKNQDKRFYSWLHFHPLFDDEDWESDKPSKKDKGKHYTRRGSEQINLKKDSLMESEHSVHIDAADSEDDLFQGIYAGISSLFEKAQDEDPAAVKVENAEVPETAKAQAANEATAAPEGENATKEEGKPYGFLKNV